MGSLSSNSHGASSASSYGMINHHNGLGATSVAAALAAANASSFKGLPSNAAAGGRIEATMSSYPNNLTTDQFLPSHHQNRVPTATAKTPASMTGTLPPLPQLQSFSCPTNHLHSAAQPQQQQQQLNQLGSSFHITPTTNPSSSDSCLQNSLQHGVSNIGGVSNHTVAASSMGVPTSAAVLSSLLPSIPSTLLSQEDPGWEGQFDNIRRFHKQFGHCNVPARFKGNPKLGHWVMTQRRQYTLTKQGKPSALTADRVRKLEDIGFVWSVRPDPVEAWATKFDELKAYKKKKGDCLVPQRYHGNMQLGTWVHTQRRHFKLMREGKKSSMTKEKIEKLNSVGFCWSTKEPNELTRGDATDDSCTDNNDEDESNET